MFSDPTMLLLIPALLLSLWAQVKVKSTFARYSKVDAASGMTGSEVARRLLKDGGLDDVEVESVEGNLTDHYDPRSRKLRLSASTSQSKSVAALGVAAHEVGHAIQHQKAYGAFQLRQGVFPVANLGSTLAFPLFIAGLLFSIPWNSMPARGPWPCSDPADTWFRRRSDMPAKCSRRQP
jgi:Zn-dependent membrane protease YugP